MKQEIAKILKPLQSVSLATCEGESPRVRPMTMIVYKERFFFATGTSDNKTTQLKANPRAEFMLLLPGDGATGYLRASGIMQAISDLELRKAVADFAPFIYDYFHDAADPGYMLFELHVQKLGYMKPGEMCETIYGC
ncbi:MAG TPA: pyridoxamine 5'-phosphate oxidase family protein [Candidatus Cloacimonadota bacterium]|nr:pyridoxamine 5'-phosphate oxidase family protein [Candidatus Cloacimonadota bacterium]